MLQIRPTGDVLGATVTGIDLSQPMSEGDYASVLRALGEHGVLRFPDQLLESAALRDFSGRFGTIQYSLTGTFHDPEVPEVGILSNMKDASGQPIGFADAGQDWHTDMSYRDTMGFVNVLNAHRVPVRDGVPRGNTMFANMHAAYEALDPSLKDRLKDCTATHDFNKFWEGMRLKNNARPALTAEQRAKRPPSVHPVFLTHPITGRKVLYCNPGYAIRINEMDEAESDRVLAQLFAHQLEPRFIYTHVWQERDLLIWDNIGTLHNAIPDYRADEPRMMKRCQVMADRVFQPGFLPASLRAA